MTASPRLRLGRELLLVSAVTGLALAARVYLLPEFPLGLHGDEAANGLDALSILRDDPFQVFFERDNGREPLFIYLQAISILVLGATPFALRVTSAVVGALTIPAVYWMVREAFAGRTEHGRWLAVWTALFIAVAYWHVTFSRHGLRPILVPLIAAITFAWFWRAWRQLESGGDLPWISLVLCGVFAGLGVYTYQASRLVPLLIMFVAGVGILQHKNQRLMDFARRVALALVVIGGTAMVVFAPLAFYFYNHPQSFSAHSMNVSIFSPGHQGGGILSSSVTGTVETFKMFAVNGDPNRTYNPADRPLLDPLLVAWLVAGLVLSALRWRSLPRLATVAWFLLFLVPSIWSRDSVPNSLRILPAIPAVFLLPVLAMYDARVWLEKNWLRYSGPGQVAALLLPLPFLLLSGITGLGDYFASWQRDDNLGQAFDTSIVDAAEAISQVGTSEDVWILPITRGGLASDNTLQFLYRGAADHGLVVANERRAPEALTQLAAGRRYAYLPDWPEADLSEGYYAFADPKHLIDFLLRKYGREVESRADFKVPFTVYELPAIPDYRVASALQPMDVGFAGTVKLTGMDFGHTAVDRDEPASTLAEPWVPAGHSAWVVLRWESQVAIDQDLKASVRLTDDEGHLAGQVDDLLVGDDFPFPSTWPAGQPAGTYHILPVLPAVAPGTYELQLVVYEDKTGQTYGVDREDGAIQTVAHLGHIEVTAPANRQVVLPQFPLPEETCLNGDLCLVGYDVPGGEVAPGGELPLTLYWRAVRRPTASYDITIELKDARGKIVASHEGQPTNGRYPTTDWLPGQIVRDWQDVPISSSIPPGTYELGIGLNTDGESTSATSLGFVEITGRPHRFDAPDVEHRQQLSVGDSIVFLGYDVGHGQAQPRDELTLKFYWQAEGPIASAYTVFVHVLDAAGNIVAQKDAQPGEGTLPTTSWIVGEYILDTVKFSLDPAVPAGDYNILLGMYDASTGARLPVFDAAGLLVGDHILLEETLTIR